MKPRKETHRPFPFARVAACAIAIGGAPLVADAGPISVLYLTTMGEIGAVQGDSVVYRQPLQVSYEWAIAVGDTVRTASYWASFDGDGREYALGLGEPIGTTSTPNLNFLTDGATDGQYNYGAVYDKVYRFGTDWSGGEELFAIEGPYFPGYWVGITYDPFTNSLWVMEWQDETGKGTTVAQFSMAGVLLSSFSTGMGLSGNTAGLAMDYADGTLWLSDESMWFQFDTDGNLLGSQAYVGGARGEPLFAGLIRGAEFAFTPPRTAVPEPGSLALLSLGLAGLGLSRRRRGPARYSGPAGT